MPRPLTQATGPPRSDAGVGIGMLRGGNRYVEGESLIFGYLMLNDALGYPYYRLINIGPTNNQQPTTNNQQPTTLLSAN